MQIRPPYQNKNLAQVGIINEDIQLMKDQKKVEQKLSIDEAVATLGSIPDEINFTHKFYFKDRCCEKQEESIFFIESIGELKLGGHIKCKCERTICCPQDTKCCPQCIGCKVLCKLIPCCNYKCCSCKCCECCGCYCCSYEALHFYPSPIYILKNEKIRFEHYVHFAKLYIQDTLVLEFYFSPRNFADQMCCGCKSNVPHVLFTNPLHDQNEKIYFEPLGNKCPTNPGCCYCCLLCSSCGIGQLERKMVATVGENGSANIIARRLKKNAWLSQCGCQDDCCHFIDYPDFEMKFTNLSNIQKLGLIMSTISYTIFGRWEKYGYRGLFRLDFSYLDL